MALTFIKQVENTHKTEKRPRGYVTYLVECSCGRQYFMLKKNFLKSKTCTYCHLKELARKKMKPIEERKKKPPKKHWHHMKGTHFYRKWLNMKSRCTYSYVHGFKNYGGRGIKCEWETFESFRDDMYESYLDFVNKHGEKNTTIDRIDVNGNYNKENCRWMTMLEQQSNKRNNHRVTYKGKEYPTIKGLCELLGKNYPRVFRRITVYGWSVEDAIDK